MDEVCDMQMGGAEMGGMMAWMLIGGLLGLALLVLAIVGIVWLVRRPRNERDSSSAVESPEEVLRRRYAAGEIDEAEYLQRRAGLQD